MGEVLFRSGIATNVLEAIDKLLGRVPGRLALIATGSGALFAALSGSTMANTAMLGTLLLPQMRERKYSKHLSIGSIIAGGGLAMIIPPSALAVVYGSIANVSIGQLLIAGIIPGILMASLYSINIVGRCLLNPNLAPKYEIVTTSFRTRFDLLARYVLPLGLILFAVLGVMFVGIATPTEAASLGAAASLILAVAYRHLGAKGFAQCVRGTVHISVMMLFIMAGAQTFSQVLAFSGATRSLVEVLTNLPIPPIMILVMMQVTVLILGCFIEQVSIMLITIPIFMPIVHAIGWDPVWFGAVMLVSLHVAHISPPFGLLLFVKGVAPSDVTMGDIIRAIVPFLICDLVSICILIAFPILTLWLPSFMR